MQITDRSKDVIKSGGEWISSIDLENLAVGHPEGGGSGGDRRPASEMGRAAAAGHRARRRARRPRKDEILAFMQGKIAKWWMPDDVVFVDEIPHTATGKIQKTALRERSRITAADRSGMSAQPSRLHPNKGLGHWRPSPRTSPEDYFFFLDLAFFAFLFFAMVFPLGWEAPEGTSASNIPIRN